MCRSTTLAEPATASAASASAIESAPPEQARPYRPGPTRSIHALTAARSVLTGSRGMVPTTQPLHMSERDVPPPSPLARLRAQLAGPRGYRRIEALLSHDDAAEVIAALSPSEVYELVHEVGFEDGQALIEYATPAQIQGCIDLDGWNKDELEVAPLKPWIAALIEVGYEKVGE